jgi:hypothetical protein
VFAGQTSVPVEHQVQPLTRSATRLCGVLFASLLLVPAGAQAAQINGDPLTVAADDDTGRLGATFTGSGLTEFFGSGVDSETGALRAGNAGFVVVTVDPEGAVDTYGSRRGNLTATSAPVVTGTGVNGDPFKIVQTFQGGTPAAVEIRQELSYVNGQTEFQARMDVKNLTATHLGVRASMGADLTGGGSDTGSGLFEAGPPRFVAGFNPNVGAVAGLKEITPWTHYEEGQYSSVLSRADSSPSSGHLADTIDPTVVDNGAAVQWDAFVASPLPPGGSATYEVAWQFARTYNLTPETQSLNTGDTAKFTVSTRNTSGGAQAGSHVRWASVGTNTAAGDVRTGADGTATFEYIGANPGFDRVAAYVDVNDNGVREEGEPQREANVEWAGPAAPAFAQQVNVRPVSGKVLIKLPRGAQVKGKWAHAAQLRFVPLTEAKQVPIGAEMDTSRGRVSLTSAKSPTGGVQTAQFYSGRFITSQPKRERGMTEVRMSGPMQCSSSKLVPAAKKARSRRLWGSGKGRFRTRGRNSSATVRGTTWLQKDTCTTTTTIVHEGVVIVKDFAKRKNVRVKAGKRYTARARSRRTR